MSNSLPEMEMALNLFKEPSEGLSEMPAIISLAPF